MARQKLPGLFDDILSLRRSIVRHVYPGQAVAILNYLSNKERKFGVQKSWRNNVIRAQHLRHPEAPKNATLWSVATGTYESKAFLYAAHLIPAAFGKSLVRQIFGNDHDYNAFWAPSNALLLPKGLASALDDWAVTIVPCDICAADYAKAARDLRFRVLDPHHEGLDMPLTGSAQDARRCRDAHGLRLQWVPASDMRPAPEYLYFWHRCAAIAQLKRKGVVFPNDDLTDWWARLLKEVALIGRARRVSLNWSMPGEGGAKLGCLGEAARLAAELSRAGDTSGEEILLDFPDSARESRDDLGFRVGAAFDSASGEETEGLQNDGNGTEPRSAGVRPLRWCGI